RRPDTDPYPRYRAGPQGGYDRSHTLVTCIAAIPFVSDHSEFDVHVVVNQQAPGGVAPMPCKELSYHTAAVVNLRSRLEQVDVPAIGQCNGAYQAIFCFCPVATKSIRERVDDTIAHVVR